MARARAGLDVDEGWIIWRERAVLRVEAINKNLVQAEVGHEREAVGRVNDDGVGVGVRLAKRIHAAAGVLHKSGAFAEAAVGLDGEDGDVAAGVIRREYIMPGLVEADVARVGAARRNTVEEFQLAGVRFDFVGGHRAGTSGVAGVKMLVVGMNHEIRG